MQKDRPNKEEDFTGKYESAGLIAEKLICNFYSSISRCIAKIPEPKGTWLEAAAGDGHSTTRLNEIIPPNTRLISSEVRSEGAINIRRLNGHQTVICESITQLAHEDNSMQMIFALEVLEHLENPEAALAELARVSSDHVILSVPREPIWRILNMARFKYASSLGNTPGHIQHWSTKQFIKFVEMHLHVVHVERPLPWSVLLCRI